MFIPGFTGSGPPMPQAMLPESSFLREAHTAGHPSYPQGFGRSLDAVGAARVEGPAAEPNEPNTYISGCVPPSPPPPAPTPDRAARPRRPRDVRNVGGRTSAVPFSARVPRRMMTDRSRLRERGFARIDILGSRPGRAPRGGAGTDGGPARSRLGVLPLGPSFSSPAGRRAGDGRPFRPFSRTFFEHLLNASPRVATRSPSSNAHLAFGRPPRALTP